MGGRVGIKRVSSYNRVGYFSGKRGKETEPKKAGWETQGNLFRLSLVLKCLKDDYCIVYRMMNKEGREIQFNE